MRKILQISLKKQNTFFKQKQWQTSEKEITTFTEFWKRRKNRRAHFSPPSDPNHLL